MNALDHLLALIDARLAALRAATADEYAAHHAGYKRRAEQYALAIRVNGERMVRDTQHVGADCDDE